MVYELGLNVDALTAIDTHVHIEVGDDGHNALPQPLVDAASKYFKTDAPRPGLDDIAIGAASNNDVLIPFGSVDPTRGADAITQAQRLAGDFGVRGFKFHPTVQNFNPSDQFGCSGLLTESELDLLAALRVVLDTTVQPLLADHWEAGAFPHEIVAPLVGLDLMNRETAPMHPLPRSTTRSFSSRSQNLISCLIATTAAPVNIFTPRRSAICFSRLCSDSAPMTITERRMPLCGWQRSICAEPDAERHS